MKPLFILHAPVAGVALAACAALLAGCDSTTTPSLEADVVALSAGDPANVAPRGRGNGTVTVPITIRMAMEFVVPGATEDDCENDLIDPETGELFTAIGLAEGRGNHLGRFRLWAEHPTINLCSLIAPTPTLPAPGDVARTGSFEIVASDRSRLTGRYDFMLLPPEAGGFMTMTVEGGTGRFQGATGQLALNWGQSGELDCPDGVCLAPSVLDPAVFDGTLTLVRP